MKKYKDIVSYIMDEISNKNIKFGERLPTIRSLSERFQCSKVTVVHAYEELQKNHIVYSIAQSGYYLVEDKNNIHNDGIKKEIIDFSSGAPGEEALPYEEFQHCLNQAINIYKHTLFNYSDAKGLASLVDILYMHFQEYQIFCNRENIFITAGAQQAISILCNMPFPNGKSNVLVEQPTYNGVIKALEYSNASVIGIERNFSGIDFNELERKFANGNIKCFYTIPRFHNPLGTSYSNEEKKKIVKLAEKYDVYIIEDDYLADLEIKNNSYPMYYFDIYSRVVYIKSFSKILLPGLRVAAVVLPKILINTFYEYKKWSDLGTSILSQGALEIYIKSGMFKGHVKKIKLIYENRMKALKREVLYNDIPCIKWHVPDTGFYSCIEFLNSTNTATIINGVSSNNIHIMNMKKHYIKDYFNNNILKISISRANLKDIRNGIPIILRDIGKSKKIRNLNIFDI